MRDLLIVLMLLALTSCDTPITVELEEVHAERDVDIAKEKTKQAEELTRQMELELKILEQNKR